MDLAKPVHGRVTAVVAGASVLTLLGGVGGAVAHGMIDSDDIANQSIRAVDIQTNGVGKLELQRGSVGWWGELNAYTRQRIESLAGEDGRDGDVGPQGTQGEQGPRGSRGETGPQGPPGEPGMVGPAGPQGVSGISTVLLSGLTTESLSDSGGASLAETQALPADATSAAFYGEIIVRGSGSSGLFGWCDLLLSGPTQNSGTAEDPEYSGGAQLETYNWSLDGVSETVIHVAYATESLPQEAARIPNIQCGPSIEPVQVTGHLMVIEAENAKVGP